MISVLIPTYNYNVYPLVREMHKQLDKAGIDFEIRVCDDASTQKFESEEFLYELSSVTYTKNTQNSGRIATRYRLAGNARYEYLLFMDADVFPADRFFVSKLIKNIETNQADVFFGGIKVPVNLPDTNKSLRWKYGKFRENKPLSERLKNPYKSLLSGSFVIKKNVFLDDVKDLLPLKRYGLDPFFSYKLKLNNRNIYHYINPVTHLGLETNSEFLNKTTEALKTYKFLIDNHLISKDYIKITALASKISQFFPRFLSRSIYKISKPLLEKNLLSSNPSLKLFDIYKLLYFSQLN